MPATAAFVQAGALRLHSLTWPAAPGSRPAVLLHGLASNARIWELTAPFLAAGGLAPVAFDLRGHGLSDKLETGYDFATLADDLAAATRTLGLTNPLLIGHSLGAYLALELATRAPDVRPAALVFVDGGVSELQDLPGATWEQVSERLTPPRLAGTPLKDFRARLASPERVWRPDERAMEILLASFVQLPDGTIAPHLTFERHMRLVRALWNFATYERLRAAPCPIFAILAEPPSEADGVEAAHLEAKRRGLDVARSAQVDLTVRWMKDTIHDIPLQRPQALAGEILRFARRLAASR
jgi:pimeloyl-ACP methyl ester carboxylesterase